MDECENLQNTGLMPRILKDIFDRIDDIKEKNKDIDFNIKCTYFEIQNEIINDLLDEKNKNLKIKEERKFMKIEGATEEIIYSPNEAINVLNQGIQNRRTGYTSMNEKSSRSHSIFTITVESEERTTVLIKKRAQLHLVDLAGSERQKDAETTGERL